MSLLVAILCSISRDVMDESRQGLLRKLELRDLFQQECRRFHRMHARRDVGDFAAVALAQSELGKRPPNIRFKQLISQRHPDDVNQVAVILGRSLAKRQQRLDVGQPGCRPRTSAAARRTKGSASFKRLLASSKNADEISDARRAPSGCVPEARGLDRPRRRAASDRQVRSVGAIPKASGLAGAAAIPGLRPFALPINPLPHLGRQAGWPP